MTLDAVTTTRCKRWPISSVPVDHAFHHDGGNLGIKT